MKKLMLSALVVGSLLATSCKEAKKAGEDLKDGAGAVVEGTKAGASAVVEGAKNVAGSVKSAVAGVTIPEFKDPKVGEYLQSYSEYAKEYIDAGKDAYKNADIVKKGQELAAKSAGVVQSIQGDPEALAKFNKVMAAIGSKMAPAK